MVGVEDVEGYEEEFVCGTENEECALENRPSGNISIGSERGEEEKDRGFTELL